jgi:hypothetical protein
VAEKEEGWKQKLLTYNLEDCAALSKGLRSNDQVNNVVMPGSLSRSSRYEARNSDTGNLHLWGALSGAAAVPARRHVQFLAGMGFGSVLLRLTGREGEPFAK